MKEAGAAKKDASRRHEKKIQTLMKRITKENEPFEPQDTSKQDGPEDGRLESEKKRFEKQMKRIDEDLRKTLEENEDLQRVGVALGSPLCPKQQQAAAAHSL
jgi:acyl-CoA thioesterase